MIQALWRLWAYRQAFCSSKNHLRGLAYFRIMNIGRSLIAFLSHHRPLYCTGQLNENRIPEWLCSQIWIAMGHLQQTVHKALRTQRMMTSPLRTESTEIDGRTENSSHTRAESFRAPNACQLCCNRRSISAYSSHSCHYWASAVAWARSAWIANSGDTLVTLVVPCGVSAAGDMSFVSENSTFRLHMNWKITPR